MLTNTKNGYATEQSVALTLRCWCAAVCLVIYAVGGFG